MTIKVELRDYENQKGLQNVRILISDKGKRTYIPTAVFVAAKDWDEKKGQVKGNVPSSTAMNQAIMLSLADVQRDVAINGVPDMKRKKTPLHEFIDGMAKKLGERNTAESMGVFNSQAKKIKTYAPNINLQDITPAFLEKYETYCRGKLANNDGGMSNTIQFIKQVVNKGISQGLLPANQLSEFKAKPYRPNEKVYLTRPEMDLWENALKTDLTERELIVGYYFLLSCYTGLRHRDCMKLHPGLKVNDRLVLYTNKTKTPVSIAMSAKIEALFNKCLELGKLPAVNKSNPYLPTIAKVAGIKKHLSFHCARHSFGMGCATLGIRIEHCSKLMGHTSLKTTGIYYRLANPELDEAMAAWG